MLLTTCQYLFCRQSIAVSNAQLQALGSLDANILPDGSDSKRQPMLPKTINTVLSYLSIQPCFTEKICCPSCFCLYEIGQQPDKCEFKSTSRSATCGQPLKSSSLQKGGGTDYDPAIFVTQSLIDWLRKFLHRPGMEDLLDQSLHPSSSDKMSDIWDASAWKGYKDANGSSFTKQSGNLVFSLNVDWFNPLGNKLAGKKISLGTIAMTCYNLPPHLRTRPENMFLAGLMPGPKEPSLEQINHLLGPLVAELEDLWKGVLISSTPRHPLYGRIVRVRLGPIICDLPAIRKVLGFAGHSAKNHLCSYCLVRKDTINGADLASFKSRENSKQKQHALRWKKADTHAERKQIVKKYGVRFSILWNLPYLNLVTHGIVEPMHNIFLGLLKHHGQSLLGLKKVAKGKGRQKKDDVDSEEDWSNSSDPENIETDEVSEEEQTFNTCHPKKCDDQWASCLEELEKLGLSTDVAPEDSIAHPGNNTSPIHGSTTPEFPGERCQPSTENNPLAIRQPPKLLVFSRPKRLKFLTQVVQESHLPSSVERVPLTVGTAAGGKLKADNWMVLFKYILVPTLALVIHEDDPPEENLHDQFSTLLHLVSIINLVKRHQITHQNITALRYHLKAY
ncbi:hypothetical protein PSTT_02327 [Puccinia striiformis]|uniref:Transposase domain-containing protein n=1 Tax=Puccinia striiformis TaxID=27350 RepID=A0A2S4W0B5_9BASI|nr:hypothetical protein PSTT_02327 [Puccinia striiformis]